MRAAEKFKVRLVTVIQRFESKGEKSGWTYIEIPADIAEKLQPGVRKSYRVKGLIDRFPIEGLALIPMGKGAFILPLNAAIRKGIGKKHGASVSVRLSVDTKKQTLDRELMACLKDEPEALQYFKTLSPSHQRYFSKWVESAKTIETKSKRIALIIDALLRKLDYGQMIRESAGRKKEIL